MAFDVNFRNAITLDIDEVDRKSEPAVRILIFLVSNQQQTRGLLLEYAQEHSLSVALQRVKGNDELELTTAVEVGLQEIHFQDIASLDRQLRGTGWRLRQQLCGGVLRALRP